ncbi:MAG: hypothetical protein HY535_05555 [Chloroflexi bacterium]|nr:hypothetical protein [Chloroflexota bacterium]
MVDQTERRLQESFCLACGARTYADRPRARATVKPALRLPDVFPAYQTWRQHRETWPTWVAFKRHLDQAGYQLARAENSLGLPGPLLALKG